MNRPKEYDREELLATITNLFWERGFAATSMNEIVAYTKVNKFSLYNEFGCKDKLLLTCMDYYIRNSLGFLIEVLSNKPLGLSNIEIFFDHRINISCSASNKNKTCLMFNSVMEREILNKEANLKVNIFISKLTVLFRNCLNAAQERSEISKKNDSDALANYLTYFTFGLVSLGMRGINKKELKKMTKFALAAVEH